MGRMGGALWTVKTVEPRVTGRPVARTTCRSIFRMPREKPRDNYNSSEQCFLRSLTLVLIFTRWIRRVYDRTKVEIVRSFRGGENLRFRPGRIEIFVQSFNGSLNNSLDVRKYPRIDCSALIFYRCKIRDRLLLHYARTVRGNIRSRPHSDIFKYSEFKYYWNQHI